MPSVGLRAGGQNAGQQTGKRDANAGKQAEGRSTGVGGAAAYSWNNQPVDSAISEVVGMTSDGVKVLGRTATPWKARAEVRAASMMTMVRTDLR